MQTPEHQLSPIERRILSAIAARNEDAMTPDWLAVQRLKVFGYIEVPPEGRPTITAEGKRALEQER